MTTMAEDTITLKREDTGTYNPNEETGEIPIEEPPFKKILDIYLSNYIILNPQLKDQVATRKKIQLTAPEREEIERDVYNILYNNDNNNGNDKHHDENYCESVLNSLDHYLELLVSEMLDKQKKEDLGNFDFPESELYGLLGEPIERTPTYDAREAALQMNDFREKVELRVWRNLFQEEGDIKETLDNLLENQERISESVYKDNTEFVAWVLANLTEYKEHIKNMYGDSVDVVEPYTLYAKKAIPAKAAQAPTRLPTQNLQGLEKLTGFQPIEDEFFEDGYRMANLALVERVELLDDCRTMALMKEAQRRIRKRGIMSTITGLAAGTLLGIATLFGYNQPTQSSQYESQNAGIRNCAVYVTQTPAQNNDDEGLAGDNKTNYDNQRPYNSQSTIQENYHNLLNMLDRVKSDFLKRDDFDIMAIKMYHPDDAVSYHLPEFKKATN